MPKWAVAKSGHILDDAENNDEIYRCIALLVGCVPLKIFSFVHEKSARAVGTSHVRSLSLHIMRKK